MQDFLHLFPDLQSLKAGKAVKCLHSYLSRVIETFCLVVKVSFYRAERKNTSVKDFKGCQSGKLFSFLGDFVCFLGFVAGRFCGWALVARQGQIVNQIYRVDLHNELLQNSSGALKSPPPPPSLLSINSFSQFKFPLGAVWLCEPFINPKCNEVCEWVREDEQSGGAQPCLLQLTEISIVLLLGGRQLALFPVSSLKKQWIKYKDVSDCLMPASAEFCLIKWSKAGDSLTT